MLFPQVTYPVVVWGLYTGIAAAAVGTTLSRFTTGGALRSLIAEGATSPESAKTAAELGLTGASARALRGSLYGKLFICANEVDAQKPRKGSHKKRASQPQSPKKRLDMSKARFYIPKEKVFQATDRFPRPSILALLIGLAILTALFVLLSIFLPSIVSLIISSF